MNFAEMDDSITHSDDQLAQLAAYRMQHERKRRRIGMPQAQSQFSSHSHSHSQSRSRSQAQAQWICPSCTLMNEPTAITCAVCLAERPDIAAATASAIVAANAAASQAARTSVSQAATNAIAASTVDDDMQQNWKSARCLPGEEIDHDHEWREQLVLPPTAPLPTLSTTLRWSPEWAEFSKPLKSLSILSWNISDFGTHEVCSSQAPASWTVEENRAALHCVLCRAVADGDGDVIALQECSDSGFPFTLDAGTRSRAGGTTTIECTHCGDAHIPLIVSHVRTLSARSHSGYTTLLLRRCLMPRVRRLFTLGGCPPLGFAAAVGVTLELGQPKIGTGIAGTDTDITTGTGVAVHVDGPNAAALNQVIDPALVDVVSMHLAPHKHGAAERLKQLRAIASALLPRTANVEMTFAGASKGAGGTSSIPAALVVGDANWRQCETASLRSLALPTVAGAAHYRADARTTAHIDRLHDHKPAFGLPTWDCVRNDYFGSGWRVRAFFDRMFVRQGCSPLVRAFRRASTIKGSESGDGDGGTAMLEVGPLKLVGADPIEAGSSMFYLSDHFGIKAQCTFTLE